MWWVLLTLIWWCGTSAIPSPGLEEWKCPEIEEQPVVECSCDMPHTLRCTGDKTAMQIIGRTLRALKNASVSLLDCTVQNVSVINGPLLEGVSLHGLVISSGELRDIHQSAFAKLGTPLQALGLPNNQLSGVPILALSSLPELDRLDLSGNRLKTLEATSFKGLKNLSFVDLSDNILTKLTPNAFANLPVLKILRLRGNRLSLLTVSRMEPMPTLEELDLSANNLVGPIGPKTFPKMVSLRDLQLCHNTLSSLKMGCLEGLSNLATLSLHHNQIDVIEDHAFRQLGNLVSLDLAYNRIVAVSGASLAHLMKLTDLDLRNNYLRAVTPDLVLPLKRLKTLKLDDNDISIVASDAFRGNNNLKHLTLGENPLNCDCSLTEFALWLINSSLPKEDKSTALCTTPPNLENGLLIEVPVENLLCGDDDDALVTPALAPSYRAKINLNNFNYDGANIKLQWTIENGVSPYTCDAIFIFEEEGPNEVLIESTPITCNSSDALDPKILNVNLPNSISLQEQHKYRYCIALFESEQTDDVSLVLGCSDIIPLEQDVKIQPNTYFLKVPKVISIQADLTQDGNLPITVKIYPEIRCELNLAILEQSALISQRKINCTDPTYTFVGLTKGPYRVCANVVSLLPLEMAKSRCVSVFGKETKSFTSLDVAFVSIFLLLCFMVMALIWGVRRLLSKPKLPAHQCFMPPDVDEEQHNRYVKLHATTKL